MSQNDDLGVYIQLVPGFLEGVFPRMRSLRAVMPLAKVKTVQRDDKVLGIL